jgi:hypothetical protein
MAKAERPLQIDIPGPVEARPIWARVGIVAVLGFAIGIAWPRLAGVRVGPAAPSDGRPPTEAPAAAAASGTASAGPSGAPLAPAPTAAATAEPPAGNVLVGPGKIQRGFDKKGKKQETCGELQFDPLAVPKLRELGKCASAIGLEGKLNLGFEVHFEKKEVHVTKGKKNALPASTVQGVLQCAAREMANLPLDEVPHKWARYTLAYQLTFVKPGKPAEEPKPAAQDEGDEPPAGQTTNETGVTGSAVVGWDTSLLRKEPKDGEVIARLVRGTKVKLVGRQNDWYKVDAGSKVGWIYRGSIGL